MLRPQVVRGAVSYLSTKMPVVADPYPLALIALAKLTAKEDASREIATLLSMEHNDHQASFWDLQLNTLFYGWGFTGRVETTALVVDALATAKNQRDASQEVESALNRGTLFLLKNKDRYGVWYSTQATVNVLQALVRQFLTSPRTGQSNEPVRVLIDGKPGPNLSVSSDIRQLTPQHADLTAFLPPGRHTVALENGPANHASAYLNVSYYLSWTDPSVVGSTVASGDTESLRYSVQFEPTRAATGEPIRCKVHAERVGFRGYGMMLAEVGLPPGTDVDRASLDAAVESAAWDVQSDELQPDRVVFYVWPRAGGTSFSFSFKPRFPMTAASAESILYDYYNPEARASVPPARFVISPAPAVETASGAAAPQAASAH